MCTFLWSQMLYHWAITPLHIFRIVKKSQVKLSLASTTHFFFKTSLRTTGHYIGHVYVILFIITIIPQDAVTILTYFKGKEKIKFRVIKYLTNFSIAMEWCYHKTSDSKGRIGFGVSEFSEMSGRDNEEGALTLTPSPKALLFKYFYVRHITHWDVFPTFTKTIVGPRKALGSLTHPTSKELFSAVTCGMNKVKRSRTNNRACDLPITRLLVPERLVGDEENLAPFPGIEKPSFPQRQIREDIGKVKPRQWQPWVLLIEKRLLGAALLL